MDDKKFDGSSSVTEALPKLKPNCPCGQPPCKSDRYCRVCRSQHQKNSRARVKLRLQWLNEAANSILDPDTLANVRRVTKDPIVMVIAEPGDFFENFCGRIIGYPPGNMVHVLNSRGHILAVRVSQIRAERQRDYSNEHCFAAFPLQPTKQIA